MSYSIIALENIESSVNLRISIRNSSALGVNQLIYSSKNINFSERQDDTKQYKNIPVLKVKNIIKNVPFGAEIVLVELSGDSSNLETFKHPENGFYIFGNEKKRYK